jgi:hydrogenase expression/formation protein HypC
MCLAVPGKVLSIQDGDPAFRTAQVDFCGVRKRVNLAYTPEVEPGDFVLVHVGFAVSRVNAEDATQIYKELRQIGALEDEDVPPRKSVARKVQERRA